MPYYRSGYNRYGRWPYRSWRRGSVTRQQQSGRRYFNISFPVENILSLTVAGNQAFSNVLRTNPWLTPVGTADTDLGRSLNACGLPGSIAYRRYCQLYDQVKINSVSFSISIADTIGSGGIPGVRVYTSWDRDFVNGDALVDADGLINGPESQVVTFINNSRAKFYRYNSASDLQERTVFVDSSNLYTANQFWTNEAWYSVNRGTGGYSPSMSLVLQTSNTVAASRTITLQIQARYNVTFRNPKYGLSVEGNAKGLSSDEASELKFSEMKQEAIKSVEESAGVNEGSVLRKKVKIEEPVYEESVVPDDGLEMDDESSQPQLTKEQLLEMLKKYEAEKS